MTISGGLHMFTKLKNLKWGLVLSAVLIAALLSISPVFAEGEVPPDPVLGGDAAAESPPETPPETAPEENIPADETIPEVPPEEIVTTEEPAPEATPVGVDLDEEPAGDTPPEEPASDVPPEESVPMEESGASMPPEEPLSEVVAAVEESGLTLVDESGDALPLTETGSAELLSGGDPWFVSGTVTYRFMYGGGCTPFWPDTPNSVCVEVGAPLSSAVSKVAAGFVPNDRTIHVDDGSYIGVTIDGSTNVYLSQLKALISENGSAFTTLTSSLNVFSPSAGFILSGFTINGSVVISAATGTVTLTDLDVRNTGGNGIYVDTKGSVVLTSVESSNNGGYGAHITNYGSTSYYVKITNSEFDDNDPGSNDVSLEINSSGPVTLDGVSASRNRGDGADIYDGTSVTIKNSVFTENYATPDTPLWGYGLYVDIGKPTKVTLLNVLASSNENDNISITTFGAVTATNIETQWSTNGNGLSVDNSGGLSAPPVTITNGFFESNQIDGLLIYSKGNVLP